LRADDSRPNASHYGHQVSIVGRVGPAVQRAATQPPGRRRRYLAPVALAMLLAAVIVVVVSGSGRSRNSTNSSHAALRNLPPYWTVRPGDTYAEIAQKTGLTIEQLEAFNANTGPDSLEPGQRLNLWAHPPPPPPPPPLPMFWTVKAGQSFGSIAAATGVNLATLEHLNPGLNPVTVQPGARVRLRH
jgi:LysM repeat protein